MKDCFLHLIIYLHIYADKPLRKKETNAEPFPLGILYVRNEAP